MTDDEKERQKDDVVDEPDGFTILGEHSSKKRVKTSRVLPEWLANPTIIDSGLDDCSKLHPVEDMPELDPSLTRALRERGIKHFFPVQREVIPWLIKSDRLSRLIGRQPDLCVSAPTGSGKTLAYVLPIVHALRDRLVCHVRALVIVPVKDLAIQVFHVFREYCKGTTLKVGLAAGGDASLTREQNALVRKGQGGSERSLVDVVVATPGRLLDHLQHTPGFSLSELRYLVIDEADRMMKEVQHLWLVQIERAAQGDHCNGPSCRCVGTACAAANPGGSFRKLLYSATLSQDPERLQAMGLFHPRLFTAASNERTAASSASFVGKYTTPAELSEFQTPCRPQVKPLVVWYLLRHRGFGKVLCFTNSVSSAQRLCLLLREMDHLKVASFSSNLNQKKRNVLLRRFARGDLDVLVTSDVLTRGMDVEDVGCTILYDCPPLLKTYIHRVGRTARAGKPGTAITLLEPKQQQKFESMLASAGKERIPVLSVTNGDLQPFEEVYGAALARVSRLMLNEKTRNRQRKNPFHKRH